MQKRGIEEWIVRFVQAMYNSTRSKVRVLHWTPWEFLYGVDLVIITETEDELKMKLIKWKINLEAKESTWMQKTKIMVSVVNLQTLKDSDKYSCSVCRNGVVLACIGPTRNAMLLLAG